MATSTRWSTRLLLAVPLFLLAPQAFSDELVDLRASFQRIPPYTKPASPPVAKGFSIPGPGTLRVTTTLSPWFRSSEPVRFRSLVPVDGRDEAAWTGHVPGVERVSSVSTPERWVDGAALTIVNEYRVSRARPSLEIGLFPSTVRHGDGAVEQLENAVQVTITWARDGEPATTGAGADPAASGTWVVVEKDLNSGDTWQATWTVRVDGRSFDAHWKKTPGGEEGDLHDFARIQSITGEKILVDRPGLGTYRGTISSDRRRIAGDNTWCRCSWEVRLPQPLPESLR